MAQTFNRWSGRASAAATQHPERARPAAGETRSAVGVPLFLRGAAQDAEAHTSAPARGTPIPFPHASAISAFTGMSVGGSEAVHDPSACAERRVPAFTDGFVTHFASRSPALQVAAHEAAHHLQHAGLTNDSGMGAERHAHAVARAVASGGSSRHLLGSRGAPVARSTRHYTEFSVADQIAANQWMVGTKAKVGDEGRTVTTQVKHECYADPALITEANAILKAKGSGVNIEPGGGGPSGFAPGGSGFKSTVKVNYKILSDEDNEEFYADCGVSAREVMGEAGADVSPMGIYQDAAGTRQETARSKNPADFRDEIFMKAGLGPDRASAHAAYNALSGAEKDEFDKKHGINQYAAPGVGEAYTRRRDDMLGGTGFNFHWGGVIMVAGGDRVTFENYTKGKGYKARDEDWYFATYGPPTKPGQTWHEQWASVGGAGKGTTLAAATSADPSPFIKGAAAMSTADLIKKYHTTADEGERMALGSEVRNRWIKVTVFVKEAQEGTDEIYVTAAHGGREYETGEIEMGAGQKNTFWIPLDKLAPVSGKILVKVYDSDVLSDDMISIIGFDDPYAPQSDDRPWDDAEYHTTVEFDR